MNSRMEKYNFSTTTASRSERNQKLYNQVDDIDVDYIDLNDETEIDLFNTSKSKVGTRADYHKMRGIETIIGKEEKQNNYVKEKTEDDSKSYDVQELLQKARAATRPEEDNKKRFINTEYNILTKLDLEHIEEEKEEMKKENLKSLIDTIYSNTLPVDLKKEANRSLMSDMMETVEMNEEISKKILDDDSTTKVVNKKSEDSNSGINKEEENDELRKLINETFVSKADNIKQAENKETLQDTTMTDDFDVIDKKEKKFNVLIIILSVLAVLAVGGVILAKYLGLF